MSDLCLRKPKCRDGELAHVSLYHLPLITPLSVELDSQGQGQMDLLDDFVSCFLSIR